MKIIKALSTIILLLACVSTYGQEITVNVVDKIQKHLTPNEARIDFISSSPNLKISENNGEKIQEVVKSGDGKYLYTCICNIENTNKFGFIITVQGGNTEYTLNIYIEEYDWKTYDIIVEDIHAKIEKVEIINSNVIIPKENTAMITLITDYNKLVIQSQTGELVEGPKVNSNGSIEYTVTFDLSSQESRNKERGLKISADGINFTDFYIGKMSPKEGKDISVVVIQQSCYRSMIAQANQSFRNGSYRDAYMIYKEAIESEECKDKPKDLTATKEQMDEMRRLINALIRADSYYTKAESFRNENQLDSCLFYHGEALSYRNYILQKNPSDSHCAEESKKYKDILYSIGRIISGKVVDGVRLGNDGKNLPKEGIYIYTCAYSAKDIKNIKSGKIKGKIVDGTEKYLGLSATDGGFTVNVPRNTDDWIYVLLFTTDRNDYKSHSFEYIPKDNADIEKNLTIKIYPKNTNSYNK